MRTCRLPLQIPLQLGWANALQASGRRIVFAESCTAGLASSLMAEIPGVSDCFCGSAVVYRNDTKQSWLGIPGDWLSDPEIGPVSQEVADAMATGVLQSTPEADLAAAITGHLGPHAPSSLDGVVCIAVAERVRASDQTPTVIDSTKVRLQSESDDPVALRDLRRREGARLLLLAALRSLQSQ